MTIKKLVSIVLLTSIAASAVAGHKNKNHHHRKNECCKKVGFDRNFKICLSFEQEILNGRPRPQSQAPQGFRGKGVSGSLELCFAKDLSSVSYKLCVCGVQCVENLNELVTQAHLHFGRPCENGPVIAFLFPCDPETAPSTECGPGVEFDGCIEGCLTNRDIIRPSSGQICNIASLYAAICRGEVYANVHGSNFENCVQDGNGMTTDEMPPPQRKPGYSNGLIRGLIVKGTGCPCPKKSH